MKIKCVVYLFQIQEENTVASLRIMSVIRKLKGTSKCNNSKGKHSKVKLPSKAFYSDILSALFECDHCESRFSDFDDLNSHVKRVHGFDTCNLIKK